MRPFKQLIEFCGANERVFRNEDIKCPVCGEMMWIDDSQIDSYGETLYLVCKNECCKMNIKLTNDPIFWSEKI